VTVSQGVGIAIGAVAALALVGNAAEVLGLARLAGAGSTVKVNSAVGLLVVGAVLVAGPAHAGHRAVRSAGVAVAALGAVTVAEHVTGWNAGLDELVADDPFPTGADPGRMAELTAVEFVLVGAGIAGHGLTIRGRRASVFALALALVLAVVVVVGHLFGASALQSPFGETAMALVSAACFVLACSALLARDALDRSLDLVLDDGPGGLLVRRFLPAVVAAMFVIAWARVIAARRGWIDEEMGVALLTTMISVVVVLAFVLAASRLRTAEQERRLAERSARAAADDLQSVIDSAPAVVTIKDAEGRFRFVNRRMRDLFGGGRGSLVGLRDADVFGPAEAARYEETDRIVLETGTTFERVDRVQQPDGEHVYLALKFPLRGRDGTVSGVGMIATDMTEQTAAADRERDLEARLARSQRLEALGQLAGGIAHDFNNLLTVILVTTELLHHDLPHGTDAERDVRTITTAAERARDLTSQLLGFARRTMGRPEVVDLRDQITRHAELLRRTLGDPIDLVVESPDVPLPVRIDTSQFAAALVNLAVNARDAMPDGGRLTIACDTAVVDAAAAGTDGSGPGPYACLTVSDTGVGMPPDVAARAFEPFYTTKGEGRGSGLGLATVYGSVAAAGGMVRLDSEPGVGTAVRVYLPLLPGTPVSTPAQDAMTRRTAAAGSVAVLVVEDEPTVLAATGRTLADAGFRVLEAGSPDAALELAAGSHVDVVVTDVMMPGMTGPQLVDRLHDVTPDLPVVYVSGYTAGVLEPRRLIADGAVLVEKPFTQAALVAAVDAALERAG
jgi:PAS domain S-box-containing protein